MRDHTDDRTQRAHTLRVPKPSRRAHSAMDGTRPVRLIAAQAARLARLRQSGVLVVETLSADLTPSLIKYLDLTADGAAAAIPE